MKRLKTHAIYHFFLIVLSSAFLTFLVLKLSLISLALVIGVLTFIFFGIYLLMMRRYLNLQKMLTSTLNSLYEDQAFISFARENNMIPPTEPTSNSLKLFDYTTRDFEKKLNNAIYYIKKGHEEIMELNRLNICKSSTLDTILAVSHHFLDHDNDGDFYNMILNAAINVIDKATKGSILLLNSETGRYEYQAAVGYKLDVLKKINYALEETFLYKNANGDLNQSIVITCVEDFNNSNLSGTNIELLIESDGLDIAEALSTPIVIDNKVYVILNIDSDETNAFADTDIQLIQFFSNQISIALKNKILAEETIKLSKFDKLTGAYNRNYFEKIFENHSETTLENMEPFALVLCDLNFLKIINDTYGHTAGDLVLSEFSSNIQNSIRDSDVFSRVGGDEFVILLKNVSAKSAEAKMKQVFDKFENHKVYFNGHKLPVSFSYGMACSPDDSMVYDVLVKVADMRMYEFKNAYKKARPEVIAQLKNGL